MENRANSCTKCVINPFVVPKFFANLDLSILLNFQSVVRS